MKNQSTFVFKVTFDSTSILLKVQARDEEEAFDKLAKKREVKDCFKVELVRTGDS